MLKISSFIVSLMVILMQPIFANKLPVKNQDVSPQQLEKQNIEIAAMAATQLSKDLPKTINKFTKIVEIKAVGINLIYIYEINTGAKSDDAIIAEDRTKWEQIYVQNICKSSKRFIDAKIELSFIYKSAITKRKLFQFDVNQKKCFKIFGSRYGDSI